VWRQDGLEVLDSKPDLERSTMSALTLIQFRQNVKESLAGVDRLLESLNDLPASHVDDSAYVLPLIQAQNELKEAVRQVNA
jgi:hypothetical protein